MFEAYTFNQHGRTVSPTARRIGYHTILMEKNARKNISISKNSCLQRYPLLSVVPSTFSFFELTLPPQ